MSLIRIQQLFEACKHENRAALLAYVTAGDPDLSTTLDLMQVLVDAGCDLIELGVPFSDPMADGPVIQASHERALRSGTTLQKVLGLLADFRKINQRTPVMLMGYLNPFYQMGLENFCGQARSAGLDGVLVVDMPVEESAEFNRLLERAHLAAVGLVSPSTSRLRLSEIAVHATGFLYYIALKGVTGASHLESGNVMAHLMEIKKRIALPLVVGFGINNEKSASALNKADGIVVGSALVSLIADNLGVPERMRSDLSQKAAALRLAINRV